MERMNSLDQVFLAVEDPVNQMSIGSVAVFQGAAPPLETVREYLAGQIHRVPRCRQRVREPSGPFGRPVWVDDMGFDLDDHVHHRVLHDRDPAALEALVADLLVPLLDRRRALWEVWVVDGFADDRWAIVAKVHHCMVDGIAGTDLLSAILDHEPRAAPSAPDGWTPSPAPSAVEFARFSLVNARRSLLVHLRNAVGVFRHPRRSWQHLHYVITAARRLWYRQRHELTSLTGPIGPDRCWRRARVRFEDISSVRESLGGTVNDVVVAAVCNGFRELLIARGESVEDRTVTALIPVSLRARTERGSLGNRVANVHALLPVAETEPAARLEAVHDHLEDLKASHEVEATGLLLGIGDYVPRMLSDRVARAILRRQSNVETVITNVPGPRSPLYLLGHEMLEGYPVAPIGGQVRITVAIWSYGDHLAIGITGDRDTARDIDRLSEGITRGFTELLDTARAHAPGADQRRQTRGEA